MNRYFVPLIAALTAVLVACGGDDDAPVPTSTDPTVAPTATLTPLEASLASVVLRPEDLPEGLERSAPDFNTNEERAAGDLDLLERLIQAGRQLAVEVQFITTDRLDQAATPIRGGLVSSATAYTNQIGAGEAFRETADEARAHDWQADYPDSQVIVVEQPIGDESYWVRVTSSAECSFVTSPTPDANGVIPTPICEETKLLITDRVIFRSGRVRGYLEVTTLFEPQAPADITFVTQVKALADIVVQRATAAFPS